MNTARHILFLIASARENGNSEHLARAAASTLPGSTQQTWLRLHDLPLPAFEDIRHSIGEYPQPEGHARTLVDATLAATDLVMISPLYWYSVPTSLKRYLDEWSAWMRVPGLDFKSRMANKTMYAISASSGGAEDAEPMFKTLQLSAAYLHLRWGGQVLGNGSKPGDIERDTQALEAARKLLV